ncbi:MAG: hypothetical protein QE278_03890 [Limnobacter sp.]|nr:hypothetical protein [Limnobacter sp.]
MESSNPALNGNNKASRIFLILSALIKHSDKVALKDAWKSALGLSSIVGPPEVSILQIHQGISCISKELDLIEEEIQLVEFPPRSLWVEEFKKIRLALAQNTNGSVANIKHHLDLGVLKAIESVAVSSISDSLSADEEEISNLSESLDILEGTLKRCKSIPAAIRSVFLERIKEMRTALIFLKISGTKGLSLCMEGFMAGFCVHTKDLDQCERTEVEEVKSKILDVIKKAAVVTAASEVVKLGVSEGWRLLKDIVGKSVSA